MNRITHITGVLGALALALVPTWTNVNVPLAAKISVSITIALGILFSTKKMGEVVNLLMGTIGIAGPLLTIWMAHISKGTSTAIVVGTILAVFSNLKTAFGPGVNVVANGEIRKTPPSMGTPILVFLFFTTLSSLMLPASIVSAEPASPQLGFASGNWTCQPATAAGLQLNLKTGNYQRVAFLEGFGCTYRGYSQALGLAGYVGYGIAKEAPNAYQGALLFSYADVLAFGPGVQTYKDPVDSSWIFQGTLTLVVNYNLGASPTYLGNTLKAQELRLKGGH